MDQIGFAERLAYVRWLLNRGRVEPLKDAELAAWMGVHPKWLAKWKGREDAPPGRAEALAIREVIQPWGASIDWLYDGVGDPPEVELWKAWLAARSEPVGSSQRGADVPLATELPVNHAAVEALRRARAAKRAEAEPKRQAAGDRPRPGRPPRRR